MSYWIHQLPLNEHPDQPIVLKISQKKGAHSLDLDLLATNGDEVWRGKVRNRNIDKLRDSEYSGSRQEWESYLEYALGCQTDTVLTKELQDSLNVKCRISGHSTKSRLVVDLQISVEDIKSRRGSIILDYSPETDDVSFYDWTCTLAKERDQLRLQKQSLEENLSHAEDALAALKQQLEDFVKAKETQDSQMLAKFACLLNEKKLRIRLQQRQLAERHKNPLAFASTNASSKKKRRHESDDATMDGTQESDGFEAIHPDSDDDDNHRTNFSDQADRTDDDTATESESDLPARSSNMLETRVKEQSPELPPSRPLPFVSREVPGIRSRPGIGDVEEVPAADAMDTASDSTDEL